jgi:uncharacterized protein with HEPN domain
VTYREHQRLADIQAAIEAIRSHLQRGDLSDGLIFDAIRIRLLEIGEAAKALPDDLLATQPSIPWRQIARMRDHLAHRYFDTAHAILQATVDEDLPALERAVEALNRSLADEEPPQSPGLPDLMLWQEATPAHLGYLSIIGDCFLDNGKADPLLFRANRRGVGAGDEISAESRLRRTEAVQHCGGRGRLGPSAPDDPAG